MSSSCSIAVFLSFQLFFNMSNRRRNAVRDLREQQYIYRQQAASTTPTQTSDTVSFHELAFEKTAQSPTEHYQVDIKRLPRTITKTYI